MADIDSADISTHVRELAAAYRRMIAVSRPLAGLPLSWQHRLLALASAHFGPFPPFRERFESFAAGLGLDAGMTERAWRQALAVHGRCHVNCRLHRHQLARIDRAVENRDSAWPALMAAARNEEGGLVLTWHHEFHHTLFALAGLAGGRVSVISAPEDEGPLSRLLLADIQEMHAACATHFNGGSYLFLGAGAGASHAIAKALKRGDLVFSLHDFASPGMRGRPITLLGRRFEAPSGAIELALRLGRPIHFAGLTVGENGAYRLRCQRLDASLDDPLASYGTALTDIVREQPWSWLGWQWFADLPQLP